MNMLKDLRKKVAKKLGVPPFVVFQDPSLEDMALKYPITMDELKNVHGVGDGKAKKYGKDFIELIGRYVDENEIERPDDLVVKSTGANSSLKLYIIQNVDRKLPLDDIAAAKGLEIPELVREMEQIVFSGTKLDLGYYIDDILVVGFRKPTGFAMASQLVWHMRLNHAGSKRLENTVGTEALEDGEIHFNKANCVGCMKGKATRKKISKKPKVGKCYEALELRNWKDHFQKELKSSVL